MIKFLLREWPESIHCKTDKDSDVFNCVDMVGKYHPTKELVTSILKFAQMKVAGEVAEMENTEAEAHSSVDDVSGEIDGCTSANYDCDESPHPKQLDLLDIQSHVDDTIQTHEIEGQSIDLMLFEDVDESGNDHPLLDIAPSCGGRASQDPEKNIDLSEMSDCNSSNEIHQSLCEVFGQASSPDDSRKDSELLLGIAHSSQVDPPSEGKRGSMSDVGDIDDLLILDVGQDSVDDDDSRGSGLLLSV